MIFAAPLPGETHIVKHQNQYTEINGKPVEDLDVTEYNDNGNIVVKGQYNNEPFFYTNKPEFRNKPVTFLLSQSPLKNRISRTLTPFRRKTHKLRDKLNQINKNHKNHKNHNKNYNKTNKKRNTKIIKNAHKNNKK